MMKKLILLLFIACGIMQAQTYLTPLRDAYKLKVSQGYDSTATTIVLSSGQGAYLPSTNFELVWYNASKYFHPFDDESAYEHFEWIKVGTRSGDTLKSVLRGQNRTTPSNHNLAGYTYRVMPLISEAMWNKIDTAIIDIGGYERPTRAELIDTLNSGTNTMTSTWNFNSQANFNSGVYMATGTSVMLYLNGSGYATGLSIPTSVKLLGGGTLSVPVFYHIVGAGGASVSSSNDTIYITAGAGGASDSVAYAIYSRHSDTTDYYSIPNGVVVRSINGLQDIMYVAGQGGAVVSVSNDTLYVNAGVGGGGTGIQGVQNTNSTLDITDPTGPTVTINVKNGGIGNTQLATGAVGDSAKLGSGVVTTSKFSATAKAPYAGTADNATTATYATSAGSATSATTATSATSATTAGYATTAGGAPPTGSAGGDLTGPYPNPSIGASKVTSTKILDGTISTQDFSSSAKTPFSTLADSALKAAWAKIADSSYKAAIAWMAYFADSCLKAYQADYADTATVALNAISQDSVVWAMYSQRSDTSTYAEDVAAANKVPVIVGSENELVKFNASQEMEGSGVTTTSLVDSFNAVRATAANATNLTSGTVPMAQLGSSGTRDSTTTLCGDGVYRDRNSSGSGITFYGVDAFTTTAAADTVVDTDIEEGDVFLLTPYFAAYAQPDTGDVLAYICKEDSLIVTRGKATGTSGLNYVYARIASGGAFNPENLTSATLMFWAEGRRQSSPPVDSTRITSMTDNSENAYHATNSVSRGAFYRTNVGGRAYYEFNGNTDSTYMNSDNVATAATGTQKAYTVFTVLQYDSLVASRSNPFCTFTSTLGSSNYNIFPITKGATAVYLRTQNSGWDPDSGEFEWTQSTYTLTAADSDNIYNAWNILELKFDGDTLFQYWNNMTEKVATWIVADTNAFNRFTVGAYYSASSGLYVSPAYVKIGALFVFSGELSLADRTYMYTKLDEIYSTAYTP